MVEMILSNQIMQLYFILTMQTVFYTNILKHLPGPRSITQVMIDTAALRRT